MDQFARTQNHPFQVAVPNTAVRVLNGSVKHSSLCSHLDMRMKCRCTEICCKPATTRSDSLPLTINQPGHGRVTTTVAARHCMGLDPEADHVLRRLTQLIEDGEDDEAVRCMAEHETVILTAYRSSAILDSIAKRNARLRAIEPIQNTLQGESDTQQAAGEPPLDDEQEREAEALRADDAMHYSPLAAACRRGSVEFVERLLRLGAPVHECALGGITPLMFACTARTAEVRTAEPRTSARALRGPLRVCTAPPQASR